MRMNDDRKKKTYSRELQYLGDNVIDYGSDTHTTHDSKDIGSCSTLRQAKQDCRLVVVYFADKWISLVFFISSVSCDSGVLIHTRARGSRISKKIELRLRVGIENHENPNWYDNVHDDVTFLEFFFVFFFSSSGCMSKAAANYEYWIRGFSVATSK